MFAASGSYMIRHYIIVFYIAENKMIYNKLLLFTILMYKRYHSDLYQHLISSNIF
jgi:hypothetical protein